MSTIRQVAKAFVEGRSARCHNAVTDGFTYWLHGSPIATKGDGVVKFDFCGWRTPTTRNHMGEIISAGKLGGHVSTAQRGGSPDRFERPADWARPAQGDGVHQPPRQRYHRIDGWRGYEVPAFAVAGASDTGMWSDSPAPSDKVKDEIERFQAECLGAAGIKSKLQGGTSSNVFCGKVWVTVGVRDFPRAAQLALNWLEEHRRDTEYLHDACQDQLGYTPGETQ